MTDFMNDFLYDSAPADIFSCVSLGFESAVLCYNIKKLEMRNIEGWTLLMYACCGGHESIVDHLLKLGCSADVEGPNKETPLMLAVANGNENIVKKVFLQERMNAKNHMGWTALFYAVFYGRLKCIQFLLSKGANPHSIDYQGRTPIHLALKSGIESISALLLKGSEIEIKPVSDQDHRNPMGPAIYQKDAFQSPKKKTSIFRKIRTYALNTRSGTNKENEWDHPCKSPGMANILKSPRLLSPKLINCKTPVKKRPTVEGFMQELDLEKYWPIFRDEEVDFETLLTFNETNLKEIGIKLYGPRRKILMAIQEYNAIHGTENQFRTKHFCTR